MVVLSGAGISAESGLKTFRDSGGLWEGHDVMSVASPEGWANNASLVLDFYNERRNQLLNANPNEAHKALALIEKEFDTYIITQNVDDLHERAGSTQVLHLHGELLKARSISDPSCVVDCREDIKVGDLAPDGSQLRPHIVWFGESVPMIIPAAEITAKSHGIIVVGTSMQVYPAAGLVDYAPNEIPIYYVDPNPAASYTLRQRPNFHVFAEPATTGVPKAIKRLKEFFMLN